MKKQILTILTLTIFSFIVFAQKNINNYKYIIVPTAYSFLSEEDKYQLNSLTKFLFNKYGYTAYFANDELPQELSNNKCLALYTDVVEDKAMFKTKLRIDLKDCGGVLIMSSKIGETKEKEFAKAFNLALRDAFETFQTLEYKYVPSEVVASENVKSTQPEQKAEVKAAENLESETKPLQDESVNVAAVAVTTKIVSEEPEMKAEETNIELIEEAKDVLYAQPIENGYQIIDTTPKIVMILLKTAQTNVFIVKDQDAIVYKEEGSWFMSRNNGGKVSIEALNIKF